MLLKCEECGKFFGSDDDSRAICSSCKEGAVTGLKHIKDPKEQRFVVARNIVYEQPDISPEDLIKQMKEMGIEITVKEIMSYVRQGRLTLKNADVDSMCEDCGKKILSGRKCPTCTKAFEQSMQKAQTEIKKSQEEVKPIKKVNRMHTRN